MKFLIASLLTAVFLSSCSSPMNAPAPMSANSPESKARQIQRNGSMSLKSRSLKSASEKSIALAAQHRALVTSSTASDDSFRATLRVPATNLAPLMTSLKSVGKVTSSRVEMDDVTESYLDLQAALKNKRALRDRLRSLLSRATKVEDILKIEKELSRVQTELDQMEARLKTMQSQVAHSTLNLSIKRQRIPGPLGAVTQSTGWLLGKLNHLN